jgi:flagellar hook-length control protein FliK
MTATVVIARASAASSALSSPRSVDLRDPAGDAGSFDRQLEAARQQHPPGRDTQHPAGGRDSSARPHDTDRPARDPQKIAGKPASHATAAQVAGAASTTTTSTTPVPAIPAPALAADEAATTTTGPLGDQAAGSVAAASLAGAMLALLPSAAAALQPGGSGTTGSSGPATKPGTAATAAIDAGAATPVPTGDAGNTALTAATNAFVAGRDVLSTAAVLPPPVDASKDPASDIGQATALLAAPPNAVSAVPQILQLQVAAGSPAFGHELGQQVAWLTGQGVKQASIRLHPEELGQIDVKISMNQGRVDVVFNAQHATAVTAVQQTLPQLDQLLAQHGLSLGHAEVNQQRRGDRQDTRSHPRPRLAAGDVGEVQGIDLQVSSGTVSLLDAFA